MMNLSIPLKASEENSQDAFTFEKYCSGSRKDSEEGTFAEFKNRRPNMGDIVNNFASQVTGPIAVLVCGPQTLIDDAIRACNSADTKNRLDVHVETFQL